MRRLEQALRAPFSGAFRRDDDGAATIEFVVLFPLLIALLLSVFEAGWLMTRAMMLERGLDIASRDVRLGSASALTHNGLKATVCARSRILRNCERDLILEVVPMNLAAAYPQNQPNCQDRTGVIEPTITFTPGGRDVIMFVRACMIVDPIFPGIGLGLQLPKDSSGGFQMVSYTAFMNEPI